MNPEGTQSVNVVSVSSADSYPVIEKDAFLELVDGDIATYLGAYLELHHNLGGVWWQLRPGYSPALIARDIATLSHLGQIATVALVGDDANEALEVISALLRDEPVTLSTSFGDLVDAVNRPAIAYSLVVCVGEKSNTSALTSRHSRITTR